jgi:hypothetical protein
VQGGYGAVFAVQVQPLWPKRVSRYNADGEQVIIPGAGNLIESTGGVSVYRHYGHLIESRGKGKNCDKLIKHTDRVSRRFYLFFISHFMF